jgi:hypothetical protein
LAQIFPEWTNRIPLWAGVAGPVVGLLVVASVWYFGSPEFTDVGYRPPQPVAYSHKLHVGEMGLDCRYCHASVEVSSVANVPPTQVCMNCHKSVLRDSAKLEPIRASAKSGFPVEWVRVHDLPDYAYFSHRAHVRAGVGCVVCHGRVDQMEKVVQVEPLSMGWCLDCHRDPRPHLRPGDQVTNMRWNAPDDQIEIASVLMEANDIDPPTDCSGCHR